MQIHNLDSQRKLVAHDERAVQHYSNTQGIVIGYEQLIELWNGDKLVEANIVRKWINWETGSIHHVDSVPA
jgi:hypothetical protein